MLIDLVIHKEDIMTILELLGDEDAEPFSKIYRKVGV